jgi:hypothetical protein
LLKALAQTLVKSHAQILVQKGFSPGPFKKSPIKTME